MDRLDDDPDGRSLVFRLLIIVVIVSTIIELEFNLELSISSECQDEVQTFLDRLIAGLQHLFEHDRPLVDLDVLVE